MQTTNNTPPKKRRMMFSLRAKLLIGFTLVFSIVFAGAYYWFYTYSTNTAYQKIQDDLLNTLSGATQRANGDDIVALAKDGVKDADGFSSDQRFVSLMDWLDTVHLIEPRAWPYIYVKGDDPSKPREIIYIADLWARYDKSKASGFKESSIPKRENILIGFQHPQLNTNDDGSFRTYTDQWGTWTSAYAPIKNKAGAQVAAMGIDFEASYVYQVQQQILNSILPAFGITYLLLFVLVWFISRIITRPVLRLTKVAERIGEGDYEQDLTSLQGGRMHDEIGILAEVFELMVSKVRQREEKLKQQVQELKIEIDEVKRQRQVSEIAETDFFRDLQAKAQSMRKRKDTETPTADSIAS